MKQQTQHFTQSTSRSLEHLNDDPSGVVFWVKKTYYFCLEWICVCLTSIKQWKLGGYPNSINYHVQDTVCIKNSCQSSRNTAIWRHLELFQCSKKGQLIGQGGPKNWTMTLLNEAPRICYTQVSLNYFQYHPFLRKFNLHLSSLG